MGTNGLNLTTAQRAILQAAIDRHNNEHKANVNKQIDTSDIFSFSADKKGNIIVKIDAYGASKDGVTVAADGQWDLEIKIDADAEYSSKDAADGKYGLTTLDDSSDAIADYAKKRDEYKNKIAQKHVEFKDSNDERFTNLGKLSERFGDDFIVGLNADAATPTMSLTDLKKNIKALEAKLDEIKDLGKKDIDENSSFLTEEEKGEFETSENYNKLAKQIRKTVIDELETAIRDLKQMAEDLASEKAEAKKLSGELNKKMGDVGVSGKVRSAVIDGKSIQDAYAEVYSDNNAETTDDGFDYDPNLINKDSKGNKLTSDNGFKMPTPSEDGLASKLNDDSFWGNDQGNLVPPHLKTDTSKKLTLAAVEKAVAAYNEGKADDKKVSLDDIAQITIDGETGDILIGMKDSKADDQGSVGHDDHYDFRIGGFYNPKSGIINYDGIGKMKANGYSSTAGIERDKENLRDIIENMDYKEGKELKKLEKDLETIKQRLIRNGVPKEEVDKIIAKAKGLAVDE